MWFIVFMMFALRKCDKKSLTARLWARWDRGKNRQNYQMNPRSVTKPGAARILLEVASSNAPAQAFYASQGFAQVGMRKRYYTLRDGTKDDALLLSRPVP